MKHITLVLLTLISFATFAQKKKITQPRATTVRADSLFTAGKYKEAITTYEAALKDPAASKDARAWYRLGASQFNLNDYNKALLAFQQTWTINSRQPGLRIGLARSYAGLGNHEKAIVMIDSAVAIGFVNYTLLDSDPLFETVRKDARYKTLYEHTLDNAYPCRVLPEARAFDFWLGDWDVYATANPTFKTGFNRITKASQGCVIVENWQAVGPHQGMSINYFDPTDRKWKEKWAGSAQDIQDFYDGEYVDSAMRFKFIGRNPDGTPFTGRLTFTNMEPGKVRQHSERTDDEGKTWQTIYDFTYVRRPVGDTP